jgi:UDP-N-acetylmuramoylalanine--D-glutamate ligase
LSSYQCELIENSPRVAVITQLAQDHLGWHGGRDGYWAAKARIATHGAEYLVAGPDVLATLRQITTLPSTLQLVPPVTVQAADLPFNASDRLRQSHNLANLGLALSAVKLVLTPEATVPRLLAELAGFAPLEHRLEVFSHAHGLTWVDDTLATTPESVVAALHAYPDCPVTLVLGGSDRGVPDEPLVAAAAARTAPLLIVAMPDTGPVTAARITAAAPEVRVIPVATLADAADAAVALTPGGGVVLLSPGAPSHNQFSGFEEKSRAFRDAVAATQHPPR